MRAEVLIAGGYGGQTASPPTARQFVFFCRNKIAIWMIFHKFVESFERTTVIIAKN